MDIDLKKFKCLSKKQDCSDLLVKDQNGNLQVTQIIDNNLDGDPDQLLFQANVPALSKATYTVFVSEKQGTQRISDADRR